MNVLSIHSHVAYGHVGNAATTLPLQLMGFEVWEVHTVAFSNHPGYGDRRGLVLDADHVAAILEGVGERGAYALRCDPLRLSRRSGHRAGRARRGRKGARGQSRHFVLL